MPAKRRFERMSITRVKLVIVICFITALSLAYVRSFHSAASKPDDVPMSIGTAKMLDDGTIELRLFAQERGVAGQATLRYSQTHPNYTEILRHLGGLKPGELKSVPPWPAK